MDRHFIASVAPPSGQTVLMNIFNTEAKLERGRDQLDINRGEVITEEEETSAAAIEIKIYETKRDTERVPCWVCNEGKQHTHNL